MNLLMISLGNDVTLGKGERTIKRHLKYAKYSNIRIYMILLSPINKRSFQKIISREDYIFIYPVVNSNHFLLVINGLRKAIKLCLKYKFNLIYSQDPFGTALIANIIRKLFNIPLLIGSHSSFVNNKNWVNERPFYFRLLKLLMRFNLPLADAWRVNNRKEKEKYIKYFGLDPNRIIVNHTLVDTRTFTKEIDKKILNNFRLKITSDLSTKLLLWVGRPVKFKRLNLLIETFIEVIKKKPNTKLLLIGNFKKSKLFNDLLNNLESNIKEKIYIYSDGANHSLLSKFYRISDIYLHTSIYEGFGVVLSEAALSGLPIVSTLSDGSYENIEDKKSGFLVNSSSSKEISKHIIKLIEDDQLRKRMGSYAKKRAIKKYDEEKNLNTRNQLWREVARNGINSKKSLIN